MLLSIITINFNNVDGLRRTLESVAAQKCRDFEWIVIDGGSTDGSRELIEENVQLTAYHVSEPDGGIYNAMNKGIAQARGRYLQFLNSGDCLHDTDVVADLKALDPVDDVVYGNTVLTDAENRRCGCVTPPDSLSMLYFWNNNLNHQAIFFSEHCFEKYDYDERYRLCADRDLIIKLLFNGFSFRHWNRNVALYDTTGFSSVQYARMYDESQQCMAALLPAPVKKDYDDFVKFRDVDLAIMIKRIINSNKLLRHAARIVLYPIFFIAKHS